jgi:hypothetical protein
MDVFKEIEMPSIFARFSFQESLLDATNKVGTSSDAVDDEMRIRIRRPSFCRPSLPNLFSFRPTLLRSHVS